MGTAGVSHIFDCSPNARDDFPPIDPTGVLPEPNVNFAYNDETDAVIQTCFLFAGVVFHLSLERRFPAPAIYGLIMLPPVVLERQRQSATEQIELKGRPL